MMADNQKSGHGSDQGLSRDLTRTSTGAVDFAFLVAQTFADVALEQEILELFVAQARKVLPGLPALTPKGQADIAHLLKGSARGIGAWDAADAASRYEATAPDRRHLVFPELASAFEATGLAIDARLAALRS